jgi:TRAP-type C4-dicarboxylate transport system substrate-binding protein
MESFIARLVLSIFAIGLAIGAWAPSMPTQALAAAPASVQPIVLKLSHSVPPVSPQHRGEYVPWAEELEKRTKGRGKVDIFTFEQLSL